MNRIARALTAVPALFFDDGKLALGVLLLLVCSTLVVNAEGPEASYSMVLLVAGTLILLFENIMRAARADKIANPGAPAGKAHPPRRQR